LALIGLFIVIISKGTKEEKWYEELREERIRDIES
jgi:hypothetical protein